MKLIETVSTQIYLTMITESCSLVNTTQQTNDLFMHSFLRNPTPATECTCCTLTLDLFIDSYWTGQSYFRYFCMLCNIGTLWSWHWWWW
jgi:hypothetical protein